ncbi:hypothetical protein FQZ97_770080 [compost metagenome]
MAALARDLRTGRHLHVARRLARIEGRAHVGELHVRIGRHLLGVLAEGGNPDAHFEAAPVTGVTRFRAQARVETGLELFVAELQAGGDQVAHVDLAAAGEQDAVAIDEVDAALGLDAAGDMAGSAAGVVDAVERDPLVGAGLGVGAGTLVELHRRVLADVEGLPVQDGLVGGLLDGDRGPAVRRGLHGVPGVEPAGGQRIRVDLQAAFGKAVRRGFAAGQRLGPLLCLLRLLRGDRARGQVQVGDGRLQLLARRRRRLRRVDQAGRRRAVRQLARGDRARLRRALVGEPRRTERPLGVRAAEDPTGSERHRDGPREGRPPENLLRRARRSILFVAPTDGHFSFPPK